MDFLFCIISMRSSCPGDSTPHNLRQSIIQDDGTRGARQDRPRNEHGPRSWVYRATLSMNVADTLFTSLSTWHSRSTTVNYSSDLNGQASSRKVVNCTRRRTNTIYSFVLLGNEWRYLFFLYLPPMSSRWRVKDVSCSLLVYDTASTSPMLIGEDRFSCKRLHGRGLTLVQSRAFGILISRQRQNDYDGKLGIDRLPRETKCRGILEMEITKTRRRNLTKTRRTSAPFACQNVIKCIFHPL